MLKLKCQKCGGVHLDRNGGERAFTIFMRCDACEVVEARKAAQQPTASDERSHKAVGGRRVKPRNVVSEEVEEPAVNFVSIDELNLSARAYNALKNEGLLTVGAVAKLSKSDLLSLVGVGRLTAMQIGKTIEDFCFNYGRTKAGEADRY